MKVQKKWRDEVMENPAMRIWTVIFLVILIGIVGGGYQIYSLFAHLQKEHEINTACFSGSKQTRCLK